MASPFASLGRKGSNAPNLIPLQLMTQQAYAGPGNDWTGTSNPKSRKKIQDRVHQKARRKSSSSFVWSMPTNEGRTVH
jgi:hypothetical protein